jgi:hypothetical protein
MVKAIFKVIAVIAHTPMQIELLKTVTEVGLCDSEPKIIFSSSSEKLLKLGQSSTYILIWLLIFQLPREICVLSQVY